MFTPEMKRETIKYLFDVDKRGLTQDIPPPMECPLLSNAFERGEIGMNDIEAFVENLKQILLKKLDL